LAERGGHTDKSQLYTKVGKEFAAHKTVEHGVNRRGFYVGKDGQTTNNVENFFGNFKRSMKGTYRHCGEQHLYQIPLIRTRAPIGAIRWT
jgi:ISXO2 transposase-like protein